MRRFHPPVPPITPEEWDGWICSRERLLAMGRLATVIPGVAQKLPSGDYVTNVHPPALHVLADLERWGLAAGRVVLCGSGALAGMKHLESLLGGRQRIGVVSEEVIRLGGLINNRWSWGVPESIERLRTERPFGMHTRPPLLVYPDPDHASHHALALPFLASCVDLGLPPAGSIWFVQRPEERD